MTGRIAIFTAAILVLTAAIAPVQGAESILEVKVIEYPDDYKPDGMWAGLYASKRGRIYSGLCTEGGSSLFYEYDPATGKHTLVADLGEFMGDNGTGERSHAKIHTRFVEDKAGKIYFSSGNQGSGPDQIDPATWIYKGGHVLCYDPDTGVLEDLGLVARNTGAYGFALDEQREILYLTCLDGHLYAFDIRTRNSRDLGRVNNWDVNRMVALDDEGNVYGTFEDHWIWKYDVEDDRLYDLPVQIPHEKNLKLSYQDGWYEGDLGRPVLDRKNTWRYVEWEPQSRKIYGIECGRALLFEYDPYAGPYGQSRVVADMAMDAHIEENYFPYTTLAVGFGADRVVYFGTINREFDYTSQLEDEKAKSKTYLMKCDLDTGKKELLGQIVTSQGRSVLGLGACEVALDGKVYLCGAVSEPGSRVSGGLVAGGEPYRLKLMVWDPRGGE